MDGNGEVKTKSRALTFAIFLCLFAYAIYLVVLQKSLYDIGITFGLSASQKGALMSFNFIGFILAVLISGYLSEIFGKKNVIVIGLCVFTVASFLFGLGPKVAKDIQFYYASVVIFFIGAGSAVMEVPGSHAVYVSRPKDVAMLIERAAKEATAVK